MLEPYSLDEVIRAEIGLLYPGSQIGRPLPHEEEEATADRGVLTRTREGLALLRRNWTNPRSSASPVRTSFRKPSPRICFARS